MTLTAPEKFQSPITAVWTYLCTGAVAYRTKPQTSKMLIRVGLALLAGLNVVYCSRQDVVFQQPGRTGTDFDKDCRDSAHRCRTLPVSCSGSDCHVTLLWSDPNKNGQVNFILSGNRQFVRRIAIDFISREHVIVDTARCELPLASSQGDDDIILEDNRFFCRFNKVMTSELMPYLRLYYENLNREPSGSEVIELMPNDVMLHNLEELPPLLHKSKRSLEENYTAGCGKTKGCFDHGGCLFTYAIVTASDGIEYLRVQLESDPGRDWVAVGFSNDMFMADTSVVECIKSANGSIIVQHSYNRPGGRINEVIDSRGIRVIEAGIVDNVIKCAFDRKTVFGGSEADPRLFNITQEYHIILTRGPVSAPGVKGYHVPRPVPSDLMDLSVYEVSSTSDDTSMCLECTIKAHACLMITAWVFLASLGIFMPRYAKPYLIERQIFKSAAWFVMHRILMILCWCATASGFIIIFVLKNGDYVKFSPTDPAYYSAHPPIGITVMILVTLNPIMALLRCAPDHRRRPIFNWAHLTVGTSAQILAVINIFFGLEIANYNSAVFWLMVGYISFHVLVEAILLITKYSPSETVAQLESQGAKPVQKGRIIPTFSLIGIYAVVVIGIWIAMVVLIATS